MSDDGTTLQARSAEQVMAPQQMQTVTGDSPIILAYEPMAALTRAYTPMTQSEIKDYRAVMAPRIGEVLKTYESRLNISRRVDEKEKKAPVTSSRMAQLTAQAPVYTLPAEPPMTEKDRNNLEKARAKKLAKGQRMTQHATCFTTDLLDAEQKRINDQALMSDWEQQFKDDLRADLLAAGGDQAQYDTTMHLWESVRLTLRKPELTFRGRPTTEYLTYYRDMMYDCANHYTEMKADMKRRMLYENVNPLKFSPEYIATHYDEMRDTLDRLKSFTLYYSQGSEEYNELPMDEKLSADKMRDTYQLAQRAFTEALKMHGIDSDAATRTGISSAAGSQAACDAAVDALKTHLENSNKDIMATMDAKVQELEDEALSREAQDYSEIRDYYLNEAQTHYIPRDMGLATPYNYEAIDDIRKMIDDYLNREPEVSVELKSALEAMMTDVLKLVQGIAQSHVISKHLSDRLQENGPDIQGKVIRGRINARIEECNRQDDYLSRRCNGIKSAVKCLTLGIEPDVTAMRVMEDYGLMQPKLAQMQQDSIAASKEYPQIYAEKKQLFSDAMQRVYAGRTMPSVTGGTASRMFTLMKRDDLAFNDSVAALVGDMSDLQKLSSKKEAGTATAAELNAHADLNRTITTRAKIFMEPFLQHLLDYDMVYVDDATDDELLDKQKELIELNMMGMVISDLGKIKSIDTPGMTIGEELMHKPVVEGMDPDAAALAMQEYEFRQALFSAKKSMCYSAMRKARATAMLRPALFATLDTSSMLPTEEVKTRGKYGAGEDQVVGYAKSMYEAAELEYEATKKKLAEDPILKKYTMEHPGDPLQREVHGAEARRSAFRERVDDMLIEARKNQIPGMPLEREGVCRKIFFDAQARLEMIEVDLQRTDIPHDEYTALFAERQSCIEDMADAEQLVALQMQHYRMAGDTERMIGEPIFRSFASAEQEIGFRSMSEAEYNAMLANLSAGVFLTAENSTPEEIEAARQQNKAGLRSYYKAIKPHYDMIEKRFGHHAPSLQYVLEHRQELTSIFANIQTDSNLIMADRRELDPKGNPEDARLYHQVCYYASVGSGVKMMMNAPVNTYPGTAQADMAKVMYDSAFSVEDADHLRYLKEHPLP